MWPSCPDFQIIQLENRFNSKVELFNKRTLKQQSLAIKIPEKFKSKGVTKALYNLLIKVRKTKNQQIIPRGMPNGQLC